MCRVHRRQIGHFGAISAGRAGGRIRTIEERQLGPFDAAACFAARGGPVRIRVRARNAGRALGARGAGSRIETVAVARDGGASRRRSGTSSWATVSAGSRGRPGRCRGLCRSARAQRVPGTSGGRPRRKDVPRAGRTLGGSGNSGDKIRSRSGGTHCLRQNILTHQRCGAQGLGTIGSSWRPP